MKDLAKYMEAARNMANGTMPLYIAFDTQEDIDAATAWMKGKQKVKLLEVGFRHPSSFSLDETPKT